MHVEAGQVYHLFKQGNNGEQLFFADADYIQFLSQTRKHLSPVCEVLTWCLIPCELHFCIQATESSVNEVASGKMMIQAFSKAVGMLTSTYASKLNGRQERSGTRFKQKAVLTALIDESGVCDNTIIEILHHLPVAAGLASSPASWLWSSAADYAGLRAGKLCNLELARALGLLHP